MATVKADLSLCQGYANCVVAAGDYFDIDDDTPEEDPDDH